jgi:hypothetical protein
MPVDQALQLNLGVDQPHNNRSLFFDHYLDRLLPLDPRWQAAQPEMEQTGMENACEYDRSD